MKLIGEGGHARVVSEVARSAGIDVRGSIPIEECELHVDGVSIPREVDDSVFIAIGDNSRRSRIARNLKADYPILVSDRAIVSDTAEIGEGTVVMQGAIIQAGVRIGKHCIINTGAVVDHDCEIGDYAHISPHATLCGGVKVGEEAWVCAGATILPQTEVGSRGLVGAGLTLRHDLPPGEIYRG